MSSAEQSKVVVLLLLIHCILLPPLFCGEFMAGPCFVVHYLVSSLQSSRWERKIAGCFTLISFQRHLTVSVLCRYLTVLWVGLQCVIVAFPSQYSLTFSSFLLKVNFKNPH